jgi:ABC-type phosphate transport system substrate-binding protein
MQRTVDAFLAALGITEDRHKKQKREWDNALRRVRAVESRREHGKRSRRRTLTIAGTGTGLAGAVVAGYLLSQSPAQVTATCSPGRLTIEGSTAYTPAASAESQSYQNGCGGAHLTVVGLGSIDGLNSLVQAGPGAASTSLAMSDGPAPDTPAYARLRGHGTPVAVIVFDIIVNPGAGLTNLTISQVRGIYAGRYTNWEQVGGSDLPIRLVSRGAESGTRATFEHRVLGGTEPPVSSTDCVDKDRAPAASVTRCEEPSTPLVLAKVASTPGAIGYAESGAAAQAPGVVAVSLDGRKARVPPGSAGQGNYPFWNVEYLYTYGQLAYQAPASGFLRYMATPTARQVLTAQGLTPCTGVPALCQARRA